MGVADTRRPPLPAPTEDPSSLDEAATDIATNVTARTDQTSYSVPDDGSPITISTHKLNPELGLGHHGRKHSQTSLLIEYFEAAKTGDKTKNRPSVRVRVTPSSHRHKKSAAGSDAVQITGIGKDRKPSYTRRISLGNKSSENSTSLPVEGTDISHSSESNLSGRPPVEVEILNQGSDFSSSNPRHSRDLGYMAMSSDISSIPPDSLLAQEQTEQTESSRHPAGSEHVVTTDHLKAPDDGAQERSRSVSRERITQKVMEKLAKHQREGGGGGAVEYEPDTKPHKERRRRSSKSAREEASTNTESSLVSSSLTPSQVSYRSTGTSKVSLNNPRLLEMVEDTVRRLILPEINQLKDEKKRTSLGDSRDSYYSEELGRRLSKSSSSPNIASKPKVVLNRYDDNPGEVLSRGDSERRSKPRKASNDSMPVASDRSQRSHRRSSKASADEEHERERLHRKKSKDRGSSHRARDVAAAGIAGGVLTAAALRHHDSHDSVGGERRRKHTKSRSSQSRSTSIAEEAEHLKHDIPPMPWTGTSGVNDSDVTRTSILSAATERPGSRQSADAATPVREVKRGSLSEGFSSPASTTPRGAKSGSPATMRAVRSSRSLAEGSPSPGSPNTISAKARIAALAAAGLGGAELRKAISKEQDNEAPTSPAFVSPAQSVATLKEKFEDNDPLVPQGLRPRSRASPTPVSTSQRRTSRSIHSGRSDPEARQAAEELEEQLRPYSDITYDESGTPREDPDEYWERQHEQNDRYRRFVADSATDDSLAYAEHSQLTNRSVDRDVRGLAAQPHVVTTPHAVESAVASLMEPSMLSSIHSSEAGSGRLAEDQYRERMAETMREIDHTPRQTDDSQAREMVEEELESPVRSHWHAIREQAQRLSNRNSDATSPRSSEKQSVRDGQSMGSESPVRMGANFYPTAGERMPEIGHGLDAESEVSTNPSEIQGPKKDHRWSYDTDGFLKEHDFHHHDSGKVEDTAPLGAGLAAGALDDEQHKSLLPSDINSGNGDPRGAPLFAHKSNDAALGRKSATPTSPDHLGDEGYASAAYARSPPGVATKASGEKGYTQDQLADYERALGGEKNDPFISIKSAHGRHLSADSYGGGSPLYDSATGKGINHIQSQDIVALMDHLTVRDGQRNARDTEILVTLVRSATEMRNEFEAMKKFIAEQDRMIMENIDRDADMTVKKVLGGPRPAPASISRSPRSPYDQYEAGGKKQNIFKRALKGLKSKDSNDLARMEDMIHQILGQVEDLKASGRAGQPSMSYRTDSLDSYDRLRDDAEPGYEPEGQAGTGSTPTQSGGLLSAEPTRDQKMSFHSGYNGRRDSVNRVSTVLEGDEDDSLLDPHESRVLDHQFEGNERLTTPTQETFNRRSGSSDTPPQQQGQFFVHMDDEDTPDKQRKHKSNGSARFSIPKISRWSKTTASSAPGVDDKRQSQDSQSSQASRSGQSLGDPEYYGQAYAVHSDDRLRSTHSLAREQHDQEKRSVRTGASSQMTRSPSPLIPSESNASSRNLETLPVEEPYSPSPIDQANDNNGRLNQGALDHLNYINDELEDPKYQAHRSSLLLQHPQPRQGPTHRHQTNLEAEARHFSGELDQSTGLTDSDVSQRTAESDFDPAQWGSNPSLSLARTNKLSGVGKAINDDNGPLLPPAASSVKPNINVQSPADDSRHNNDAKAKGPNPYERMYYASPLGSGHLLEPIEEVRYSLETDSGHVSVTSSVHDDAGHERLLTREQRSPAPDARPSVARGGNNGLGSSQPRVSSARKITGPRPMGSRSPSAAKAEAEAQQQAEESQRSGTVRRKPVAGASRGHGM